MSEEPENVLEHDRVAPAGSTKEGRAEEFVGQQHCDGAGEYRHGGYQQERRDDPGPHEQRQLHERHARRPHVEDSGDDVDGAGDRRCTQEMHREDQEH